MTAVYVATAVILVLAAAITTYRLLDGPSTLDRVVAVDALVAIAMCGLAVWAAFSGNSTVVPGIVALSLIGFVGSTSVARFRVPDRPDEDPTGGGWTASDGPVRGDQGDRGGRR
ncbi:monovalent cation/H+ antiporter complex subunit F [Tsukamurella soli]|uniref:Multicomponent Na+:H+ antiporter subunit F n=1 Tax=Tsukamurella soli TaxID=644556 RepID=A0ABP8JWZ2_9ACTN